ncbi:hypothetical protein GGI07_003873 [Coemansia sp. Benny D115]|nr:hypothetical protein GGI07_003873 [Coemansia sp. Benny D115]
MSAPHIPSMGFLALCVVAAASLSHAYPMAAPNGGGGNVGDACHPRTIFCADGDGASSRYLKCMQGRLVEEFCPRSSICVGSKDTTIFCAVDSESNATNSATNSRLMASDSDVDESDHDNAQTPYRSTVTVITTVSRAAISSWPSLIEPQSTARQPQQVAPRPDAAFLAHPTSIPIAHVLSTPPPLLPLPLPQSQSQPQPQPQPQPHSTPVGWQDVTAPRRQSADPHQQSSQLNLVFVTPQVHTYPRLIQPTMRHQVLPQPNMHTQYQQPALHPMHSTMHPMYPSIPTYPSSMPNIRAQTQAQAQTQAHPLNTHGSVRVPLVPTSVPATRPMPALHSNRPPNSLHRSSARPDLSLPPELSYNEHQLPKVVTTVERISVLVRPTPRVTTAILPASRPTQSREGAWQRLNGQKPAVSSPPPPSKTKPPAGQNTPYVIGNANMDQVLSVIGNVILSQRYDQQQSLQDGYEMTDPDQGTPVPESSPDSPHTGACTMAQATYTDADSDADSDSDSDGDTGADTDSGSGADADATASTEYVGNPTVIYNEPEKQSTTLYSPTGLPVSSLVSVSPAASLYTPLSRPAMCTPGHFLCEAHGLRPGYFACDSGGVALPAVCAANEVCYQRDKTIICDKAGRTGAH